MSNGNGKGATKSISPEKHAENREAAKKRKQARHGNGKGMHTERYVDSQSASDEIMLDNKQAHAVDFAHDALDALLSSHRAKVAVTKEEVNGKTRVTSWNVVTKQKAGQEVIVTYCLFDKNVTEGMRNLLDFLFEDSEENRELAEAFPVSGRALQIVREQFVFACEVLFLRAAYCRKYDWYFDIANGELFTKQVKSRQWQLRQAKQAATPAVA